MVCRKWMAVAFIVWHLLCKTFQTNWTLALQHFNASDGTWHAFTTLLFYCFTLIFSTSLSPIKRAVIIYTRNNYILSTHTNWKQESFCFSNNFLKSCLVTVGFKYAPSIWIILSSLLSLHESMCTQGNGQQMEDCWAAAVQKYHVTYSSFSSYSHLLYLLSCFSM